MEFSAEHIKLSDWGAVLNWCRSFDVEEGETSEYMYSVRTSTLTLTIWTQLGWKEGWYVARIVGKPTSKTRLKLSIETGNAPENFRWSSDELELHIKQLLAQAKEKDEP